MCKDYIVCEAISCWFFFCVCFARRAYWLYNSSKKRTNTQVKKRVSFYIDFLLLLQKFAPNIIFLGPHREKPFFFRHLFSLVLPRVILCFLFCVRRFKLRWFFFLVVVLILTLARIVLSRNLLHQQKRQ